MASICSSTSFQIASSTRANVVTVYCHSIMHGYGVARTLDLDFEASLAKLLFVPAVVPIILSLTTIVIPQSPLL